MSDRGVQVCPTVDAGSIVVVLKHPVRQSIDILHSERWCVIRRTTVGVPRIISRWGLVGAVVQI